MNPPTTLVVPCFNESSRLDCQAFLAIAQSGINAPSLLFVDDGSSDGTPDRLAYLCLQCPDRISSLALGRNMGKAEAVRAGMIKAIADGATVVGFLDADLSTPGSEMLRLIELFHGRRVEVLMGARVSLLGRSIRRSPSRHFLGRIFASLASWILKLPVYDTQCGAKLFKATPTLASALQRPFTSRWAFDVELLGRLISGSGTGIPLSPSLVLEEPLYTWVDKPGSKLSFWLMAGAAMDLLRIALDFRREKGL